MPRRQGQVKESFNLHRSYQLSKGKLASVNCYCKSGKFSVEKYLANTAIGRKSLMINTTKFPSELSHHDDVSDMSSQSK